jgi:hypothetical protein
VACRLPVDMKIKQTLALGCPFFNTANLFNLEVDLKSTDNWVELAKACGKYLLACRMAAIAEIEGEVLGKHGPYTHSRLTFRPRRLLAAEQGEAG